MITYRKRGLHVDHKPHNVWLVELFLTISVQLQVGFSPALKACYVQPIRI